MLKGFRDFIMRGNVVDLAVAVVIGAAFGAVVTALVNSLINPLIGAIFNADALSTALIVTLPGGSQLAFGAVIAAIINFVLIALVVYLAFVLPMNKFREHQEAKRAAGATEEEAPPTETDLLVEIRDLLKAQADK